MGTSCAEAETRSREKRHRKVQSSRAVHTGNFLRGSLAPDLSLNTLGAWALGRG